MSSSWSRVWRVGILVLTVVACGSDQGDTNNGATCGEGTVLKDHQCIPQCGAGTVLEDGQCVIGGAAGNVGQGGGVNTAGRGGIDDAEAGSAGETEADAGSAGERANNGGSAGSGLAGHGGTAGANQAGGGGTVGPSGGTGGTAGTGEGGTGGLVGSAGSAPTSHPQWVVINQSSATVAYDLSKFPSPSGLVSLEGGPFTMTTWSPDGRSLLHLRSLSELYYRDMTTAVPGPPTLLSSGSPYSGIGSPPLAWSGDSKSAAFAIAPLSGGSSQTMLQVFDPTRPAPLLRTLSSNVTGFSWAPVGDRIMYVDGNMTHVRRVQTGVPGPDFTLDGSSYQGSWSPDGNAVAITTSSQVTWADLTQSAPAPVALTAPTVAAPTVQGATFVAGGTSLLFSGVQVRDGARDLFKVTLRPTVGAPVRVSSGLTGTSTVVGFWLSPDGRWVVYMVSDTGQPSTYWAVDLSAASPGMPFQISAAPSSSAAWLYDGSGRFVSAATGLSIVDLPHATTSQLNGTSYAQSPAGAMLAYGTAPVQHLYLRDLDHPEAGASDIPFLNSSAGLVFWRWSPDGKFIATFDGSSSYNVRLVRLEGTTPSTPVPISVSSSTTLYWQPVSN